MKKLCEISVSFFLCTALCSCPYSSAYNLDETPSIYVEEALLGNWVTHVTKPNSNRKEPVYLQLGKKTDTEYDIAFSGSLDELKPFNRITSDSLKGTAFMSNVGGRQFFNIRINSRIYIAEFIYKDDKISLLPLAESFTAKMVFNSTELRNCVDFHYKTRVHPVIDDEFCLRGMTKLQH